MVSVYRWYNSVFATHTIRKTKISLRTSPNNRCGIVMTDLCTVSACSEFSPPPSPARETVLANGALSPSYSHGISMVDQYPPGNLTSMYIFCSSPLINNGVLSGKALYLGSLFPNKNGNSFSPKAVIKWSIEYL